MNNYLTVYIKKKYNS